MRSWKENLARVLPPLAFWAALLFTLTMALYPSPTAGGGTGIDKVQHMLAFGALAWLAITAFERASPWTIMLGLLGLGAGIELMQAIPGLGRQPSALDLLADIVGAAIVVAVDRIRSALVRSKR